MTALRTQAVPLYAEQVTKAQEKLFQQKPCCERGPLQRRARGLRLPVPLCLWLFCWGYPSWSPLAAPEITIPHQTDDACLLQVGPQPNVTPKRRQPARAFGKALAREGGSGGSCSVAWLLLGESQVLLRIIQVDSLRALLLIHVPSMQKGADLP